MTVFWAFDSNFVFPDPRSLKSENTPTKALAKGCPIQFSDPEFHQEDSRNGPTKSPNLKNFDQKSKRQRSGLDNIRSTLGMLAIFERIIIDVQWKQIVDRSRCVARAMGAARFGAFHMSFPLKRVRIRFSERKTTPGAHMRSTRRLGHDNEMERGQRRRRWWKKEGPMVGLSPWGQNRAHNDR